MNHKLQPVTCTLQEVTPKIFLSRYQFCIGIRCAPNKLHFCEDVSDLLETACTLTYRYRYGHDKIPIWCIPSALPNIGII